MALQVVGAGLGRTGTASLKIALETLLGAPCYHMLEVFGHPEHVPLWHAAYRGELPDWEALFDGYAAAVDWPMAPFWQPISEAFPDALLVLTLRDPDSWWRSASETIFTVMGNLDDEAVANDPWAAMATDMMSSFCPDWRDETAAKRAFVSYYDEVRRAAPAERFLQWHPREGWSPICERLGVPVPDEPFPHANTTEEFKEMLAGAASAEPLDSL
jgi:hypothetical protein